ncbi:MAG: hypothetical protein QM215_03015 [Bacillota bacterium]|nr:hypothetical protein [Bacillota bacterium]NLV70744.1 hypothetical protein [Clostridiales bacterium]HRV33595.1 hypothetical protein [Anaerovoracaceae bacterium]
MAFLDKLSSVAKDMTEKAGDAVEITKLKSKVSKEKSAIDEVLQKIGGYYLDKFTAGEEMDEAVAVMCKEIAERNKTIEDLMDQIAAVKE